jgi:hypothetical protein
MTEARPTKFERLRAIPLRLSASEIQRVARAIAQEMLDRAGMRVGKFDHVTKSRTQAQDVKTWLAS